MVPSGSQVIDHGWFSPVATTTTRMLRCCGTAVSSRNGPAPSGGSGQLIPGGMLHSAAGNAGFTHSGRTGPRPAPWARPAGARARRGLFGMADRHGGEDTHRQHRARHGRLPAPHLIPPHWKDYEYTAAVV